MPEDSSLLRDFAIIMAVAGAALVIFRRIGLPPILGYLLAGIIVGPFTLLPLPLVREVGAIRLLADLGLVLLLFAVGLEFGWQRIRRVGLRVLIIGIVQVTLMLMLGYEVGTRLGWSGVEAFFLGAALAGTSSAVVVRVLRDTGKLHQTSGRLIMGISVVEDFAVVVLLSVLSGVAVTGTSDLDDVSSIAMRLAVFTMAALIFGALLVPRLLTFAGRFRSDEPLLIASLALCFGLALVGQELGISAAAGAFLIGTVIGDTEHSRRITQMMTPVRDMFAALFFVSIGMLVDLRVITGFIVPALLVSALFIAGKILFNTVATLFTGHDGRTSLTVGMGMPQPGEFNLAMAKVGADHGAVGAFFYPVITVMVAVTSLFYPFLLRAADPASDLIRKKSPRLLREYAGSLESALADLRQMLSLPPAMAGPIRSSLRLSLVNLAIIAFILAIGTFTLRFTTELGALLRTPESLTGLAISGMIVTLCVPPGVGVWLGLRRITEEVTNHIVSRSNGSPGLWQRADLLALLRESLFIVVMALVLLWTVPIISRLLELGEFAAPVPLLVLGAAVLLTARAAVKIHGTLITTFSRTFLGEDTDAGHTGNRPHQAGAEPAQDDAPTPRQP